MSDGQVKKYNARLYFLECLALFGNRTSKNVGVHVLVWGRIHKNSYLTFKCST